VSGGIAPGQPVHLVVAGVEKSAADYRQRTHGFLHTTAEALQSAPVPLVHTCAPIASRNARLLILGSMPGAVLALVLPLAAQERDAPKPAAPAVAAPASDGAAVAYRVAVARMKEQFGERCERVPERDHDAGDLEQTIALATSAEWRAAVVAATPALAQWDVAVSEPKCRFHATNSEPLQSEYMQDLFLGLCKCRQLVVARGLQAIAARDPDDAVGAISGLLAHASHLRQEPLAIAWGVAAAAEKQAARLHEEIVRALPEAAAARSRAAIRRHLETRPGLAAAGAAVRIEAFRLFDGMIAQMKRGGDAKAKIAREVADDVRRHFTQLVDPHFAVLEKADEWTPELRDTVAARGKELRARVDERMTVLKPLMRDAKTAPADLDPAADLGLLLASMLIPDLGLLAAEQQDARERLRTVTR
jgi:hypothetical protein